MRTLVHEIRNHLAIAVANVEAFLDRRLEPTQARLGAVLQALAEIEQLVGELSALEADGASPAHLHSALRPLDVCRLIGNAATGVEAAAAERGILFRVHRCGEVHPACRAFLGDPVRIAEIVTNVLSNAVRYTPSGGAIEVECHRGPGELIFSVSDRGPGLTDADKAHLFERGFRGSAAAGTAGTGIGLSLVKAFVDAHGGEIEVQDAAGGGSRFVVKLPGTLPEGVVADCEHCAQLDQVQSLMSGMSSP